MPRSLAVTADNPIRKTGIKSNNQTGNHKSMPPYAGLPVLLSLCACWVEGQKVRTAWCSNTGSLWRKTQKVRRREGEESESGVDEETEREKRTEEGGREEASSGFRSSYHHIKWRCHQYEWLWEHRPKIVVNQQRAGATGHSNLHHIKDINIV